MVHVCCVPGCSTRSDREKHISYFGLPLRKKSLLKQWIHRIGRANLPINRSTKVCSLHFKNAAGRKLHPDEAPSEKLPKPVAPGSSRPPPRVRKLLPQCKRARATDDPRVDTCEVAVNTEMLGESLDTEVIALNERVCILEKQVEKAMKDIDNQKFRLCNIVDDNSKICFYTGFPSYKSLLACFDFLGPAAHQLLYSSKSNEKLKNCQPRSLPPLEEFFLVLVRLRLGLMEQDLADRFGVSQSTVSRITNTWINFMYLQLKQICMWPSKEIIKSFMPHVFKNQYPSTRVIVDATEIYVEQPRLPELQQRTFSNYKNTNTYKALVGISPSGAVIFVSKLFPGSISDKELTRQSGILDILEVGDSVMADKGFNIEEDLIPIGVRLNIPPFLRGKSQFSAKELIETRRVASLRIHVERAMERIKNYHIFDRTLPVSLTNIADRMFYICCTLTNFLPPLCN